MKTNFKIHFIGIGGIGVSALARYYVFKGWSVSGSDITMSEITDSLKKIGAEVYAGTGSLKKIMPDIVVHSPAVQPDNPELKEAIELGIKTMSYPQALGQLTKEYFTIAVAGAHGKSTTTAMVGLMMAKAKLDPTVIVGTKVREFGDSNFRPGTSKYLVIEACEFDRSFLNYYPEVILLTNIEMDHMECYKSETKLIAAFKEFVGHLPKNGVLIANTDDANTSKLLAGLNKKAGIVKEYSLKQADAKKLRQTLKIPGDHNVSNGLASLALGRLLNIPDKKIFASLGLYKGSWRRFDQEAGVVGSKKVILVSDYGHHPTQIKATMAAARAKWPSKKIICVFQPHQAYRTYLLFKGFVDVFKKNPLDLVMITDIYQVAGREKTSIIKKVSAKKLADSIDKDNVEYVPQDGIMGRLASQISGGEVIMIMGAGNIYNLARQLAARPKKSCKN